MKNCEIFRCDRQFAARRQHRRRHGIEELKAIALEEQERRVADIGQFRKISNTYTTIRKSRRGQEDRLGTPERWRSVQPGILPIMNFPNDL